METTQKPNVVAVIKANLDKQLRLGRISKAQYDANLAQLARDAR